MTNRENKKGEMAAWKAFTAKRTQAQGAETERLIGEGLTRREVLAHFGRSPGRHSIAAVASEVIDADAIWKRQTRLINARLPNVG